MVIRTCYWTAFWRQFLFVFYCLPNFIRTYKWRFFRKLDRFRFDVSRVCCISSDTGRLNVRGMNWAGRERKSCYSRKITFDSSATPLKSWTRFLLNGELQALNIWQSRNLSWVCDVRLSSLWRPGAKRTVTIPIRFDLISAFQKCRMSATTSALTVVQLHATQTSRSRVIQFISRYIVRSLAGRALQLSLGIKHVKTFVINFRLPTLFFRFEFQTGRQMSPCSISV